MVLGRGRAHEGGGSATCAVMAGALQGPGMVSEHIVQGNISYFFPPPQKHFSLPCALSSGPRPPTPCICIENISHKMFYILVHVPSTLL